MSNFRNRFSPPVSVKSPKGKEPAQQQFKDDCDINSIMARFQKTGAIDHVAVYQPEYGLATPQDLHAAMNLITKAERMFADLPSSLRRRFDGDPRKLFEFVQNHENADEAKELGLALSPAAAAKHAELAAAAAAAEASGTPPPETEPELEPSA